MDGNGASCRPYLQGCWVGLKSVSMAMGSRISFTLFAPAFSWLDTIANSLHGSSWHMLHTKCAETSYDLLINTFPTKHLYRISIGHVSSTLAGNLGKYWSFTVFHQPLPMQRKESPLFKKSWLPSSVCPPMAPMSGPKDVIPWLLTRDLLLGMILLIHGST